MPENPRKVSRKAGEKTHSQKSAAVAHLASFPEYNPNPVIELYASGRIFYLNPAAKKRLPGLSRQGKEHPFLVNWLSLVKEISLKKPAPFTREICIGSVWYEQAVSYVPSLKRFRIYARDITIRKKAEAALLQVHDELEKRVRERTKEINKANKTLKKENSERLLAEKNVLAEKRHFNDVLEALPCYLVLLTPDYHVSYANKFFRERFGDARGRRCYEYLFNRAEPCEVCETYQVLKKMKPLEWEWVGPDGHNYYIYDFPFEDTDGSTLIMEVGIDITVQTKALAELRKARDELEMRVQERTSELKEVNRLLRVKMVEHKQAEEREQRIADEWQATFDSISDMVSIQDKDCRLVRVNKAYADALGMNIDELNGQKCYAMLHGTTCPIDNCPHIETMQTCRAITREIFEPKLGLYLEVSTSPITNAIGEITGLVHIAKDITARKKVEQEMIQLNRELRATGECNQAIVRAGDEITLYKDICRIMCDVVGYPMAWVGAVEHDEGKSVHPIAWHGDGSYLANARITWADTALGQGPTGTAARTGKTTFCQDFTTVANVSPWREAALSRGFRSSIAIPLSDSAGNIFAVFNLYAAQPDRFTAAEVELLEELAGDLAFGISVLRERIKRRQTAESLRETRDYLDNLFNYANAPIIVWNPEYRITRFNRAFERLTGLSSSQVLGQKLEILFPDNSREHSMQHIREATSGERWEVVEIPIRHIDGTERILLWNSATIYTPDGKTVVATIAQGQDITDRKKVEQMKDEFLGLVSHELRTPMTIITGSLRTMMAEGLSPDEVRELLDNAIGGADQLATILENMLELSRYQAGHLKLRVEPVSLTGTARSVIKKLKNQRVAQEFEMDIPPDLPPVEADPIRVERILYNLMENATKYTPADTMITVSAHVEDNYVITEVIDRGPGIPPEDYGRLFELFQQLDTTHRASSGAGLGLVVCKRLVEAQGGWIKVDSASGKGSVFSFALPRSNVPA